MFSGLRFRVASWLFRHWFPLYRWTYFLFKKSNDREQLRWISMHAKEGSVVIDVGANIGFYSRYFSDAVGPIGHVYAFEPDAENFRRLSGETKLLKNVSPIQKAVASESGELTLYTSTLLNVDHRTYEPENYNDKYTVEKISIDEFVDGKFKVDIIKMDIQGFEMDALKGMTKTLSVNQEVILLMEFWPYGLKKAGSSAQEVFQFMSGLGFILYPVTNTSMKLSEKEVEAIPEDYFVDLNVIATRIALPA